MNKPENPTQFLLEANSTGYAANNENNEQKQADGSTTIIHQSGVWKMHDNWFGGEPYAGREVIFLNNEPHWFMGYYGWVNDGFDREKVYQILRSALKEMPEDAPFRGPAKYRDGLWRYTNSWKGDVNRFKGTEKITHKGIEVYRAHYHGGLIDQ